VTTTDASVEFCMMYFLLHEAHRWAKIEHNSSFDECPGAIHMHCIEPKMAEAP
jgi:hypothetical protein